MKKRAKGLELETSVERCYGSTNWLTVTNFGVF